MFETSEKAGAHWLIRLLTTLDLINFKKCGKWQRITEDPFQEHEKKGLNMLFQLIPWRIR